MLVINYSGNKPQCDRFKFSVNGDNNSQTIKFVIKKQQGDIDLSSSSFACFFVCQSQDKSFVDKAEISSENISEEDNDLIIKYKLLGKHTRYKMIDVGLSFETQEQEVVWKTASATVSIQNGIMADEEIANIYPTELGRIEARLSHKDKKFVKYKNKEGEEQHALIFKENVKVAYTVSGYSKFSKLIKWSTNNRLGYGSVTPSNSESRRIVSQ